MGKLMPVSGSFDMNPAEQALDDFLID